VLQIVKEDGTVVNQYDYDAFGRVRWDSENTYENGVENRYLFQGREWDKNGGFYYFRNRIYLPERGEFATPDMNLGRGILGELDGMATLTFCGGDPVNCMDPTGLDVLSWMFGYGFSGAEATAFEQGFAEGYDGGSCIAANALTFGSIDSLKARSDRLVSENDTYRTSQGLARFGTSMMMASGGTVLLKGGMVGLGSLAAKGGAIGTAATVTKGAVELGIAGLAAKSAGDNLGTAAGEIDAGKYGWATFHASLGLLDVYSAGASGYGGYKTLSPKTVVSSTSTVVEFIPQAGWQGPSASRGNWLGQVGNSAFKLADTTADAMGVPRGTVINFVQGVPDFSSFSKMVIEVPGLTGIHAVDQPLIVKHLAKNFGMSQAHIRQWLSIENLRMHHFQGAQVQLPDAAVHSLHHTGSASALRGGN